jgi:hypothetical protein
LDTTQKGSQLKSTICEDTEYPVTKPQQFLYALDTIDISKMQFTSLGLKDLVNTGVFPSRTNSWKWKLD